MGSHYYPMISLLLRTVFFRTMAQRNREYKILIACSGSVATVKLELLLEKILMVQSTAQIKVIMTEKSQHFTKKNDFDGNVQYFTDEDQAKVKHTL